MEKGKLYLIPTPLGEGGIDALPDYVLRQVHHLQYIVAERAKTARHFIKATDTPQHISSYQVSELNNRTQADELEEMLVPIFEGKDVGIMSEAGCPGVADPGARLVELAHRKNVEVVPLVGPSSILLALMASGMNGQSFTFHGYLPAKANEIGKAMKNLEQQTQRRNQTQLFIEAPYRNRQVLEQAFKVLSLETKFCIAADLTLTTQYISTKIIKEWRKADVPDLHKRPAIFLIGK